MAQKIHEVMTPDPVTVDASAPVPDAARVMRDYNIGDVLVTENNRLRGIVTDRDVAVRAVAVAGDVSNVRAGEICTPDPVVVGVEDEIGRAVDLMRDRALRRLPVVDEGRVVGIVTLGDLAIDQDGQSALADISQAPPNR